MQKLYLRFLYAEQVNKGNYPLKLCGQFLSINKLFVVVPA